jgi:peptide/nickel transport system permease protein
LVGRPSPIDVPDAAIEAQPEAVLQGVERKAIEGRSLGQIAWMRLKRDKLALAGGVVVILLILLALAAPLLTKITGGSPTEFHQDLYDPTRSKPKGEGLFAGSAGPTPSGRSRAAGATSSPASSMARRSPC